MNNSRAARPEAASRLRHRPLFRADVAECIALLPPWLGVDASNGRFDDARAARLCRDTYDALLDGSQWLPSERDIAHSNAGDGVVFFALHYRQRAHDMSDPYVVRVLHTAHEAFRTMHSGYRVGAFFQQALLSDEPWLAGAGLKRCTDPMPGGPKECQTVLYGLTREDAAVTMPRGVYERIDDVEPEFFGEPTNADDGKRGPEKRRPVLAHVRQRPEELRPWTS